MMTLSHTRIAVQIAVEDDTGNIAAFFATLTALVSLLVKLGSFITEAALMVGDLVEAARFTNDIFTIGLKSLAWGLVGVRI